MNDITEGTLLWEPSTAIKEEANLTRYITWLRKERGLVFRSYDELWEWSVRDIELFWKSIWDYFKIQASKGYTTILSERKMPGADWFVGSELNYAEHIFRNRNDKRAAIIYKSEVEPIREISWQELFDKTKAMAGALKEMGVKRGDRVVAYMPHIPETIIAFLASASLGAIWSSCSPDFGSVSVLDRFQQIEPKVLIAVDGYHWNGKFYDRRKVVGELQSTGGEDLANTVAWNELLRSATSAEELNFEQVPFSHPLWVLYSSGTTGLPKPIVQGQGGILLEHLKALTFHGDLKPEDRFFWITSTGWMMWNFLVGGLLTGATIVVYNGSPGYPDMNVMWKLAEETEMTYFGTSAAYITACGKAGTKPGDQFNLNRLKAVGSTGSPLSVDGFKWVFENVSKDISLESVSGGTDLCTPFIGGCRVLPVYAGEIQCRYLGAKVEAFDEGGQSVLNQVGELVITEPMPSMPLYFWNDPEFKRYTASYFEMYPGIWRHGDWIKINERGGSVVYGRSDATIKRHGVRMGTSEIYQVIEDMPEIIDSLVVDLEGLEGASYMPLFVVLREGITLDEELKENIRSRIRADISPRHVPDDIFTIPEVPRTLSGKKLELPVRRILLGHPVEKAVNPDAMQNPGTIQFYVGLAKEIKKGV